MSAPWTRGGLANLHTHLPVGTADAWLSRQHEESLRARMSVYGRHAARRTTNIHEPKEVLRCGDAGNWSNLRNLSAARWSHSRAVTARWQIVLPSRFRVRQ